MRLLFVVAGGSEVPDAAETWCDEFTSRLGRRGHLVEVLTNVRAGIGAGIDGNGSRPSRYDGIPVHHLATAAVTDQPLLDALSRCVDARCRPRLDLQELWMTGQGPVAPELAGWLCQHAPRYDVVVLLNYATHMSWSGLSTIAGMVPTILHPFATDEPKLALTLFDTMLRQPTAFAFANAEEAALMTRRAGKQAMGAVVRCGVDPDTTADAATFRAGIGVGDRPYLVSWLGSSAGCGEVLRYFSRYKSRNGGPLAMVGLGAASARGGQSHSDVFLTTQLDWATRTSAIDGAIATVEPPNVPPLPAMVAEGWARGRPGLVAAGGGDAAVTPGAFTYRGFAEFEAAVDLLVGDPALANRLGVAGRRYAESRFGWDHQLGRYERLLEVIQARR